MSDSWVLALAVATVLGARAAAPVPAPVAVVALILVVALRHPWSLVVAAALWASLLSHRAWSGLDVDLSPVVAGTATLVSDPEEHLGAVTVDVRLGGRRYEAWARGTAATALRPMLTGEQVEVRGRPRSRPADAPWLIPRHIAGRLDLDEATPAGSGAPWWQVANWVRRTLAGGASALPDARRSLFLGLTVGDDRDQPPEVAEDFRAAGLTHLLAVSGQNVAFLLVLTGPLLRRFSLAGRLPATLAVLTFLALVTRFEPSVLRATAMAGLTATALTSGRPVAGRRALGLAVTLLLLVDPLLAWSAGFALSVGASAGISLLAHRVQSLLPGPRGVADPLAVTVAAQAGVAPVLIPLFGGLPVASLPANLLAVPVAGAVMVWGLPAGLLAGLLGPEMGRLIHIPTSALVAWVAGVARVAAKLPLGELRLPGLVFISVAAGAVVFSRRHQWGTGTRLGWVAVALTLLAPAVALRADPPAVADVGSDASAWRLAGSRSAVLAVNGRARTEAVLGGLRRAGFDSVRLVVVESGGSTAADVVDAVRTRHRVHTVLTASGVAVPGSTALVAPLCLPTASGGSLVVTPEEDRLVVAPGGGSCG